MIIPMKQASTGAKFKTLTQAQQLAIITGMIDDLAHGPGGGEILAQAFNGIYNRLDHFQRQLTDDQINRLYNKNINRR